MDVSPLQPKKEELPMLVTLVGMTVLLHPVISVFVEVSIIALQLSRESYLVFPSLTIMEVRPAQPKKAVSPILVTLLGMVMEVMLVQL